MQREKITIKKREIAGKMVKKLRREGILPTNVYGKDIASVSTQVSISEFKALYKKVHETGLVDLELEGQNFPVLIHNVQWNPRNGDPLHADFFKVNLREKITTAIPITIVGEPIAVKDKLGVLLVLLNELEVEALPTDLPEKIEVEVESLAQIGAQITVGDLKVPANVTILTDASGVVCKIDELITKEAEEEAAADEAAAEVAKTEEETEEGKETSDNKPEEKAETSEEKPEQSEKKE